MLKNSHLHKEKGLMKGSDVHDFRFVFTMIVI